MIHFLMYSCVFLMHAVSLVNPQTSLCCQFLRKIVSQLKLHMAVYSPLATTF